MSGVWVGLVALGLVGLGFLYLNRKIDRRLETSALIEKIQQEVDSILIELNATTERNVGLIEERIKKLGNLLDQADRKIGVFQREMDKQARSADVYSSVIKKRQEALESSANDTPESSKPPKEAPESGRKLRDKVRALRDEGLSTSQIAARLGSTVGEVELILSLLDEKR